LNFLWFCRFPAKYFLTIFLQLLLNWLFFIFKCIFIISRPRQLLFLFGLLEIQRSEVSLAVVKRFRCYKIRIILSRTGISVFDFFVLHESSFKRYSSLVNDFIHVRSHRCWWKCRSTLLTVFLVIRLSYSILTRSGMFVVLGLESFNMIFWPISHIFCFLLKDLYIVQFIATWTILSFYNILIHEDRMYIFSIFRTRKDNSDIFFIRHYRIDFSFIIILLNFTHYFFITIQSLYLRIVLSFMNSFLYIFCCFFVRPETNFNVLNVSSLKGWRFGFKSLYFWFKTTTYSLLILQVNIFWVYGIIRSWSSAWRICLKYRLFKWRSIKRCWKLCLNSLMRPIILPWAWNIGLYIDYIDFMWFPKHKSHFYLL